MKKESKKKELLDTAASILAKDPAVSMEQIANHIGVGRITLYRYFPKRNDLIYELALESIAQTDEAIQPLYEKEISNREILEKVFNNLIPLGARFHFLIYEVSLHKNSEIEKAYERQITELYKFMEILRSENLISMSSTWALYVLDGLIWAAWLAIEEGDLARNQAKDIVVNTFLTGLSSK
ncbi:TetR/AcrR family transcriptional regulator [Candidatus Uabimicrobium sp. HlEnr_7]|uniref:TetR/AcrR family transcriptional regulator n=1 Tax=Candidatus Uabimicrobium helgolandensis TaxID=3095367 RepID=UPI0035571D56